MSYFTTVSSHNVLYFREICWFYLEVFVACRTTRNVCHLQLGFIANHTPPFNPLFKRLMSTLLWAIYLLFHLVKQSSFIIPVGFCSSFFCTMYIANSLPFENKRSVLMHIALLLLPPIPNRQSSSYSQTFNYPLIPSFLAPVISSLLVPILEPSTR